MHRKIGAIAIKSFAGSPVIGIADPIFHLTQFVIAVERYSDGTPASSKSDHKH
jgi:hypothetical protein